MAVTRWATAGTILSQTAAEMGAPSPTADPFASADENWRRLIALLNAGGQELCIEKSWPQLLRTHTFATVLGQSVYQLPVDFVAMVDQSGWNRSGQSPLAGPASPQQWQYLLGSVVSTTVNVVFRLAQGQLWILDAPDNETIAFEYQSRAWVRPATVPPTDADTCGAVSDVVMFDPVLMRRLLKLRWQEAKGLDTTTALQLYERTLSTVYGQSVGGRVLSLGGGQGQRFIDEGNVPDGGFG